MMVVVAMFVMALSPLSSTPVYAGKCTKEGQPENANDLLPGIKPWYDGLCDANGKPELDREDIGRSIWRIVLNLVGSAMVIAGYIAIGFVIWGGTKYILAQGDSGKIAAAKTTIQNALIGLLIALSAAAIVNFVASGVGI